MALARYIAARILHFRAGEPTGVYGSLTIRSGDREAKIEVFANWVPHECRWGDR